MKKYLYSIVFATLILMSTTVVNASNEVYYTNKQNIEMTEKEYNNLLGLGFTENQIATMEEEEFIANKDIEGTILGEAKKYFKTTTYMRNGIKTMVRKEISYEEAMEAKELLTQNPSKGPSGNYYNGIFDDSVTTTTTRIIGINNTYMRFKVDNEWYSTPSERYYDIIGIGIESNKVQIATSILFRQNWTKADGTNGQDTTGYPKSINTGGLAIIKLPTGSITNLESTLYFNVSKKSGVGTITLLYAGGDYAHAISNVNPNTLINYLTASVTSGIIINGGYSTSYLEHSSAAASFVGTW